MVGDDRPTAPPETPPSSDGDPFGPLAPGTRVGKYEILEMLGQGGFGITYRAHDTQLHRDVAIKEYLPTAFARRQGGSTVVPRSTRTAEDFLWGRGRFLDEARTLARLEAAAGIVNVHDFLEANGTAYMVMTLVPGETLEERLKRDRRLPQPAIELLLYPLLDGLEIVHDAGFLHRDIKPANILIEGSGRPTLIDFGASRLALQGRTQAMTAVYTPGYAAPEQMTSARQGPWTDLYALAGTLYHCIAGRPPPSAIERSAGDTLVPAVEAGKGRYGPSLLAAIDAGLTLKASDRPQSVDDWRRVLAGRSLSMGDVPTGPATREMDEPTRRVVTGGWRARWIRPAVGIVLVIAAGGGAWMMLRPVPEPWEETARRAEEEGKRQMALAAKLRQEEEARQRAAAEARRKAEEDITRKAAEDKAEAEAAARRQAEEAERQRAAAAEARRKAEEEAAHKAAEEKAAAEAVAKRKADEAVAARRQEEEQARAEAEAQRKAAQDAAARKAAEDKAAADEAARRKAEEEASRRAAAEAAARRAEEQARAEDARRQVAAEKAAADEAARRKAEEEAARRAAAEATGRRAEEQARAEDARRQAAAEKAAADARRMAEEEAARRAAAEAAGRRAEEQARAEDARRKAAEAQAAADAEMKRQAEAAEAALRLAEQDRKRVQVALTSLGHNTQGTDGTFGPRTRQMIATWQKSQGAPETGYLTAPQLAALRRQAAAALAHFDEAQKRADEEEKRKAQQGKPSPEPVTLPPAASPGAPKSQSSTSIARFDGSYSGQSCNNFRDSLRPNYCHTINFTVNNGKITGNWLHKKWNKLCLITGTIADDGRVRIRYDGWDDQSGGPVFAQLAGTYENGVIAGEGFWGNGRSGISARWTRKN